MMSFIVRSRAGRPPRAPVLMSRRTTAGHSRPRDTGTLAVDRPFTGGRGGEWLRFGQCDHFLCDDRAICLEKERDSSLIVNAAPPKARRRVGTIRGLARTGGDRRVTGASPSAKGTTMKSVRLLTPITLALLLAAPFSVQPRSLRHRTRPPATGGRAGESGGACGLGRRRSGRRGDHGLRCAHRLARKPDPQSSPTPAGQAGALVAGDPNVVSNGPCRIRRQIALSMANH